MNSYSSLRVDYCLLSSHLGIMKASIDLRSSSFAPRHSEASSPLLSVCRQLDAFSFFLASSSA